MITLTTDIGWEYVAQMKAVILSINSNERIIDISHSISAHNILEGAFVLYKTVPHFPFAVHIGVVDPSVGTERRGIIVDCKRGVMVGPDNGLLIPAARELGLRSVYEITNPEYFLDKVSNTFHGRDIFAPVAAHLSKGIGPKEMGIKIEDYEDMDFGKGRIKNNIIEGKVIFIDKFGNVVTNIPGEQISSAFKHGDSIEIGINGKTFMLKFLKSYGYVEEGEALATISSFALFEISCNQRRANEVLDIKIGERIAVKR